MTKRHAGVLVAASVVLAAVSGGDAAAGSSSRAALAVVKPAKFLTRAERPATEVPPSRAGGFVAQLCAGASRGSHVRCPSDVRSGPVAPAAADDLAADLPNLRLNIVLGAMQNIVVSGTGVDSLGAFQEPWATFKIVSTAADHSIPLPAEDPYGLPLPGPGASFGDIPVANALFQGIIENGCLGMPATFDLTLDSTIFRISSGAVFGERHLVDSVTGPGYYTFRYTVRATDESGNVSDFVFSGDANAYCTAKSSFSAAPGGGDESMSAAALRSLKPANFLTQEDFDRNPDGVRLSVRGVGDVFVKGLRSSTPGKRCQVYVPSLLEAISAAPPVAGPKWLQITIYECPWGGLCCLGPLGGGCYILISK